MKKGVFHCDTDSIYWKTCYWMIYVSAVLGPGLAMKAPVECRSHTERLHLAASGFIPPCLIMTKTKLRQCPATHMVTQTCKLLICLYTCSYIHKHTDTLGKSIEGKTSTCVHTPTERCGMKDICANNYNKSKMLLFLCSFFPVRYMFNDLSI